MFKVKKKTMPENKEKRELEGLIGRVVDNRLNEMLPPSLKLLEKRIIEEISKRPSLVSSG